MTTLPSAVVAPDRQSSQWVIGPAEKFLIASSTIWLPVAPGLVWVPECSRACPQATVATGR